jgi:putative transposase
VISSLAGQGIYVQRASLMLGVSQSGYYDWKGRPPSERTLRHLWLGGEITDIHEASTGTYGAQRVTAELRHGRGITVGHNSCLQSGTADLPSCRSEKQDRTSAG